MCWRRCIQRDMNFKRGTCFNNRRTTNGAVDFLGECVLDIFCKTRRMNNMGTCWHGHRLFTNCFKTDATTMHYMLYKLNIFCSSPIWLMNLVSMISRAGSSSTAIPGRSWYRTGRPDRGMPWIAAQTGSAATCASTPLARLSRHAALGSAALPCCRRRRPASPGAPCCA